jgi:hypothetical protein
MNIITGFAFAYMTLRSLSTQIKNKKHGKVDVEASLLLKDLTIPNPHVHLTFRRVASRQHGDTSHQAISTYARCCLDFNLVFKRWK